MHEETLREDTKRILTTLSGSIADELSSGYLAGGTALALQLGHRESVDLDFFFPALLPSGLREAFARVGDYAVRQQDAKTLDGVLDGVQVSAFVYSYPLLREPILFHGVRIASIEDIGAMKLDAIASRGSKKDFIDVYMILQQYSLRTLFAWFEEKFSHVSYNRVHLLKSLTYFRDAEHEPMPRMHISISWDEVQACLRTESKKFLEQG